MDRTSLVSFDVRLIVFGLDEKLPILIANEQPLQGEVIVARNHVAVIHHTEGGKVLLPIA